MRRVLASSATQQEHWRAQILRRPLPEPTNRFLLEGLGAYAAEHIHREQVIIDLWGAKWKVARDLAKPIIEGNIPDDTHKTVFEGAVAEMEIELPDTEETDDFELERD